MKEFLKKIWNAVKGWVLAIPNTRLLAVIAGLAVAAILALKLTAFAEWCIVPLLFFAAIWCFVKTFRNKTPDYIGWAYFLGGALFIQIIAWL